MRKEQVAFVNSVSCDDLGVDYGFTAHLDNGHKIYGDRLDEVPEPGAKVNVVYSWGDDFVAPVINLRRSVR